MFKKLLGMLLGLSLATCSLSSATTSRDRVIRSCIFAEQVIQEILENNQLMAQSMPDARPARQYVFLAYLDVNSKILKEMKEWKLKNCKEA